MTESFLCPYPSILTRKYYLFNGGQHLLRVRDNELLRKVLSFKIFPTNTSILDCQQRIVRHLLTFSVLGSSQVTPPTSWLSTPALRPCRWTCTTTPTSTCQKWRRWFCGPAQTTGQRPNRGQWRIEDILQTFSWQMPIRSQDVWVKHNQIDTHRKRNIFISFEYLFPYPWQCEILLTYHPGHEVDIDRIHFSTEHWLLFRRLKLGCISPVRNAVA